MFKKLPELEEKLDLGDEDLSKLERYLCCRTHYGTTGLDKKLDATLEAVKVSRFTFYYPKLFVFQDSLAVRYGRTASGLSG